LPRKATAQARAPVHPGRVLQVAGDPSLVLPLLPYTTRYDPGPPPRLHMRFRRFGLATTAAYTVRVEAGPGRIVYVGEAEDRRFTATISVDDEPGGSLVRVEVTYEGPYEALSTPILRDMAEKLARSIVALSRRLAAGGSMLRDPSWLARLLAGGRVLARRRMRVEGRSGAEVLLGLVVGESRGRRVFARILGGGVCVRVLADHGEILDIVLEEEGRIVEGLEALDRALDLLGGREVEVLLVEA